ncbi:hypothetical protein [Kribbella sp. NPDC051770]|uniref:hypothetical protein n=1 Tax=Kribbella sp. NPDC051770 TaxID=3155413 RepID=UPI00342621EF
MQQLHGTVLVHQHPGAADTPEGAARTGRATPLAYSLPQSKFLPLQGAIMPDSDPKFFLFLGSTTSESVTSKIKTEGARYEQKLLKSKPENWAKIIEFTKSPDLMGIIATFTSADYERILSPQYKGISEELIGAIGNVPHIVFIHEAIYFDHGPATGVGESPDSETVDPDSDHWAYEWDLYITDPQRFGNEPPRGYWGSVTPLVRETVNGMLKAHDVNVMPYKTNAERSVLTAAFFGDQDRHLLFRIYVPSGRLYADEAATLLGLFQDWLTQTGRSAVRQDGYKTPAGQVYEFFSSEAQPAGDLTRQFQDFSEFLDACADEPEEAIAQLTGSGVAVANAERMVSRYGKLTRRLHLDLRHAREERLMMLRHELESELLDDGEANGPNLLTLVEGLVPPIANVATAILSPGIDAPVVSPALNVTINQQVIGQVTGHVMQSLQGTIHLGAEAKEILELIDRFAGSEKADLESAVHELEDSDARSSDRLVARQKLRRFLASLGSKAGGMALATLQKYLEHRLGLGG